MLGKIYFLIKPKFEEMEIYHKKMTALRAKMAVVYKNCGKYKLLVIWSAVPMEEFIESYGDYIIKPIVTITFACSMLHTPDKVYVEEFDSEEESLEALNKLYIKEQNNWRRIKLKARKEDGTLYKEQDDISRSEYLANILLGSVGDYRIRQGRFNVIEKCLNNLAVFYKKQAILKKNEGN